MSLTIKEAPLVGLLPEGPLRTLSKLRTNVSQALDHLDQPTSYGHQSLDAITPEAEQEASDRCTEVMDFLERLLVECRDAER